MTPTTQQILNAAAYLTGKHPAVAAMLRQITEMPALVRNLLDTKPLAAEPTDFELAKCWVTKPNGEIDGIASMRAVLKKFTNSQHQATEENADGVHARPQTVASTKCPQAIIDAIVAYGDARSDQDANNAPTTSHVRLADCIRLVRDTAPTQQALVQFNAAIDFAIEQGAEGAEFLRCWREGDTSDWPEFTGSKT